MILINIDLFAENLGVFLSIDEMCSYLNGDVFFAYNGIDVRNKKVFVSGGAGIIGQQLVKKLIHLNAKILVGDLKKCPKSFVGRVKYIKRDLNLLKENELRNFFE